MVGSSGCCVSSVIALPPKEMLTEEEIIRAFSNGVLEETKEVSEPEEDLPQRFVM